MGRVGVFLCVLALALAFAGAAQASQFVAVDAKHAGLEVNARGEALVSFTTNGGARRHVLAWGALNARVPDPSMPQVSFELDRSGGLRKYGRRIWHAFRDGCRPYDGPELVYLVAACNAPDGSYWALQSWQRIQPMRGLPAFRADQMKWELHLSHWTGPLAVLQVSPNWAHGGKWGAWEGLFGRLLYGGRPVHGFKGAARAGYGRYFYIDTFNSAWGQGWKRAAAKSTHNPNGGFCFTFVPDRPPPGYPNRSIRPAGNGERHRVTVMGPGVTPDVQWEGPGIGRYNARQDGIFNRMFDFILGSDRICAPER